MTTNNQSLPTGYKPSPLGIIPDDWEVKRLGDIAEITSGTTPSRDNSSFYSNGTIPWVKTTDLNNGVLNKTEELVTEAAIEQTSLKVLPTGTVLVAMYGGFNQIGRTALLGMDASVNQALSALVCKHEVFNHYVLAWLNCHVGDWKRLAASSRKDPNITGKDVERFPILVPKMEEQQRIVSLLSLWDTAIAKQTALIEQLTLRKRGLMQQLLTGKKRLKGFEGEWKRIKLGDITERITRKNEEDNQNVVTISAQRGFVVQTDFFNKSVASETLDNYFLVHKDEFCYNKSYSNGYPMGAIKRLKTFDKAVVTTLYICFALKGETMTNIDFFEQYCESGILNKELVKVANEGGRAHGLLNVTPTDFFNMHMSIPSIDEQNAIASVLVNADKEIEIQKQKLAAMQEQKKGLMQVLLTGKKRIMNL
jgi:type I restriction enzyme S subunit